jgi:hypothetical protein
MKDKKRKISKKRVGADALPLPRERTFAAIAETMNTSSRRRDH